MTTETKSNNQTYIKQFIATLRDENQTTKADLARLKRNAGNTLAEAQHANVFWSKVPIPVQHNLELYFLVATLFPLAPAHTPKKEDPPKDGEKRKRKKRYDFGWSLQQMRPKEKELQKSLDRRFGRLLDADNDQLPFLLRQLVQQMGQKEIAVDWERLLTDLINWTHPDRFVQRSWARSYFLTVPTNDTNNTNENEQNTTSQEN